MKFDVKLWLMYSAMFGIWAGFIIFCILLLNAQLPPPLAILIGIVVALAIGFAIELHDIFKSRRVAKENEIAHAKNWKRNESNIRRTFARTAGISRSSPPMT